MNSSVVEQIKDRLPITDVLSSYITVITAGRQYKAKCPFHNERTASFSISPERNLYYCFGCGAKGDIFTFVQQFEGVDFNGALKILAERAGVSLQKRDERSVDASPVYEILEKTTLRYQAELKEHKEALEYLKARGLTSETISQFRLGYAPVEWRFVAGTCTTDVEKKIAERAGLIKEKTESGKIKVDEQHEIQPPSASLPQHSGNFYDRFRGRIMFPLMDSSGRVIGFSGRLFPEEKEKTDASPKYLNSPEGELFQKSRVLYGFDKAKFHIKRFNFAILVEGQMDMVMSHQAGFRNTIATSGTAVSEQMAEDEHANLLVVSRLTPNLFLAFDGDNAGHKALARAALVALMLGMNPKVVPLPEGVDPAEYIKDSSAESWKVLLQKSEHFIVHQTRSIKTKGYSPHTLVATLRTEVFPYLSKVQSPIEQNLYMESIAKELGIGVIDVAKELIKYTEAHPSFDTSIPSSQQIAESHLSWAQRFVAFAERFPGEGVEVAKMMIGKISFRDQSITLPAISDDIRARSLAMIEAEYGGLEEGELSIAREELAGKVVEEFYRKMHTILKEELHHAEHEKNEEKVNSILMELSKLAKIQHG